MDVRIRAMPVKIILKGTTRLRPISMEVYDPSMDTILGCMVFKAIRDKPKNIIVERLYKLMKIKDSLYQVYKKIVYFLNHEINSVNILDINLTDDNNNIYDIVISGKEYPIVKYESFKELQEEVIKIVVG